MYVGCFFLISDLRVNKWESNNFEVEGICLVIQFDSYSVTYNFQVQVYVAASVPTIMCFLKIKDVFVY